MSKATLYAFLGLTTGALLVLCNFTLNTSPSEPLGLYHITKEPLKRGALVLLKDPLKQIVGVPGDTVEWTASGIRVNGRLVEHSAVPPGSPYPPYPYITLKLAPYQYVAMGQHPLSYDARYIGPTPGSLIASTVTPVWTEGGAH
jgi:type IV secretory pathway protease TraF